MPFSDTANLTGLIQECEFWTNLGNGAISGDPVLLPQFTVRLNRSFDRVMPRVLSHDDNQRWDDVNHPTHPIGFADIVSGQGDYTFLADSAGNSILNVTRVMAKQSASAADFGIELFKVIPGDGHEVAGVQSGRIGDVDSSEDTRVLSPFGADLGTPNRFVERGNSFFVWPVPNYAVAGGFKIFFERTPSYFVPTDTTKTAGIPSIFHQLLALYASKDWLVLHKPSAGTVIQYLDGEIRMQEDNLDAMIGKRNPNRSGLRFAPDFAY